MPSLTVDLEGFGSPVVEIEVGMNAAQEQLHRAYGAQIPGQIKVRTLVDTGCSRTLIEEGCLALLDLEVIGMTKLVTASSGAKSVPMKLHAVDLSLVGLSGLIAANLQVGAITSLKQFGVEMLLGRDVLKRGVLTYDGEKNQLTLSLNEVDRPS